jgi:hypothetical protein
MSQVVVDAGQDIWQMTDENFVGKRTDCADFGVDDQRTENPNQAVVDIVIGIR